MSFKKRKVNFKLFLSIIVNQKICVVYICKVSVYFVVTFTGGQSRTNLKVVIVFEVNLRSACSYKVVHENYN